MKRVILPLACAALLIACTPQPAPSTPAQPVAGQCPLDGDARRDAMDAAIHDYLTRHPEVLMEMSQALQQRQRAAQQEQAKKALAERHDAIFADDTDPVVGNPAGTVTVVEFFDAECPYCKRLAPDLQRLIAENKDVRVIYKEYPVLGAGSQIAAAAALASMKQGRYEVFHNALMADQTPEHQLAEPRIMEIAKGVGLDVKRLKADMAVPEIAAKIAGNIDLAHKLGIMGTPGMIIGDKMVPGAVPYPGLLQAVAEARGQKQ